MALREVVLLDAVATQCMIHALTTEHEEIIGVLLGEVVAADGIANLSKVKTASTEVPKVARIWGSFAVPRSDKRADRVEIDSSALCLAADRAEAETLRTGRRTRVLGWYHSHPHITPYPSHVDLNCQGTYQWMESGWVGLIFSVFHADGKTNNGRIAVHCFQSSKTSSGEWGHEKIPLRIMCGSLVLPFPLSPFEQARRLTELLLHENHEGLLAAREGARGEHDRLFESLVASVFAQQSFKTLHTVVIPLAAAVGSAMCEYVASLRRHEGVVLQELRAKEDALRAQLLDIQLTAMAAD